MITFFFENDDKSISITITAEDRGKAWNRLSELTDELREKYDVELRTGDLNITGSYQRMD